MMLVYQPQCGPRFELIPPSLMTLKHGQKGESKDFITKLREIEVHLSKGNGTGQAVRAIGVTEQTNYRWRKRYDGLQVGQARQKKVMEKENARLLQAISDLTLDNQILQEVIKGKFKAILANALQPMM